MSNKIGLKEYKLREVEKEIVNKKLNLIDETFTFNENKFSLKYLEKLNEFLFADFYFNNELEKRKLSDQELSSIELRLENIVKTCLNEKDNIESILEDIIYIWHLQPFIVGNTRTLVAFLKVLKHAFLLDIEVDVNIDISNNPEIFKIGSVVNQKGLTKSK